MEEGYAIYALDQKRWQKVKIKMMVMMLMTMMVLMMVTMTIMFMMKNLILLQKCEVTKLMKLFIWSALHEQTEMILIIILVIFLTSSGGKRA